MITVVLFLLYSLPTYWVAMPIYFVGGGNYFSWFPIYGMNSIGAEQLSLPQRLLDRLYRVAGVLLSFVCLLRGNFPVRAIGDD